MLFVSMLAAAWDSMRAVAQQRFERGEMPGWFDPKWLSQEEAPVNAILRNMGAKNYQYDDKWLGTPFPDHVLENEPQAESGGSDGDGGDGRGPWDNRHSRGWWREDDPYWMLRDWGDHPMRWWTLGFAALMAGEWVDAMMGAVVRMGPPHMLPDVSPTNMLCWSCCASFTAPAATALPIEILAP